MTTTTYTIPAIHCSHCTRTIELELGEMAGITAVKTDLPNKLVTVSYEAPASDEQIRSLLSEIEYPAS
jgi:copper chaperone